MRDDDPRHDDFDDKSDGLDDETLERAAAGRRRQPGAGGGTPGYEEEPGMGEDEHGDQPSQ